VSVRHLPFHQVDAFADRPFTGNPAAVMPLDTWLDDATLQAIAGENNLSETAFTVPAKGDGADYELRWFTPSTEIALCGHATLAAGHILMGARKTVRFVTRRSGALRVDSAGDGYRLALPALKPAPVAWPDTARAIGPAPAETLWHPAGYLVLVYQEAGMVRALAPDFATLRRGDDTLYIATAPGDVADVVTRAFAPGAGIDEDPVTGSAHAVIAPYWAERLGRDRVTSFQASARGGMVDCTISKDQVILAGRCRTVIEGHFALTVD